MDFSSAVSKSLLGLAVASAPAAVGGLYFYNKSNLNTQTIDDFALDYDRTWTLTTSTQATNNPFETTITLSTTDKTRTWSCQIKGTTSEEEAKDNFSLDAQKEELKTALGIGNNDKRSKNKRHNFTTFFNKCKEKGSTTSTENTFTSVIDSVSITKDNSNNKYEFNKTEFKNIYYGKDEIIRELGLETKGLNTEHVLNKTEFEAIKFEGKTGLTIPDNTSTKIKIETTDDTAIFPEGLKFTFINDKDIKIQTSDNNHIFITADTNAEFKLKINEDNYSLEKAWNITSFAKKAGLTCHTSGTNKNKCTLEGSSKVNVYQNESNYTKGATFTLNDKTISFTEGEKGYNQGFKLKVSGDIDLTGSNSVGSLTKLLNKDKSYEIGFRTVSGSGDWYLTELDEREVNERLVNLKCDPSNSTCSVIEGKQIKGNITVDANHTLTRQPSGNSYTHTHLGGTMEIDCSGVECIVKSTESGQDT